jgi:hypothetical protein
MRGQVVYRHDDTYSIVLEQNHYLDGLFYINQLDADLDLEWRYQNTSTELCERLPDGTIRCFPAGGDRDGVVRERARDRSRRHVYVNNLDGSRHAIGQGGVVKARHFLSRAVLASCTPVSLDTRGRIYA